MVDIKIIGIGCINSIKLENLCYEVVRENQYQANIDMTSNLENSIDESNNQYPILMLNDKVYCCGKLPEKVKLKHWIDDLLKEYFY